MAEIGLAASVIQIASTGLKLSTTLYSFAETVSTADKSITHIAKDVSLTSAILSELGSKLELDKASGIASENAIATAQEIILECSKIFKEIEVALGKSIGNEAARKANTGEYRIGKHVLERLRWPFLQPKMELLRSNLESLKSTLILMLQVLSYAIKAQRIPNDTFGRNFDRQQIHSLIQANQRAIKNFESLNRTIKDSDERSSSMEKDRAITSPLENHLLMDNMHGPPLKSKLNPTASPFTPLTMMPENVETIFDQHPPDSDVQVMSSIKPAMIAAYLERLGVLVNRIEQARSVLTARNVGGSLTETSAPASSQFHMPSSYPSKVITASDQSGSFSSLAPTSMQMTDITPLPAPIDAYGYHAYRGYGGGYHPSPDLHHKPSYAINAGKDFALEPPPQGINSAELNLTTSTPTLSNHDQANSVDEGLQSNTLARPNCRDYRSRKHLRDEGWKGEFKTLLAKWTTLDEDAIDKV